MSMSLVDDETVQKILRTLAETFPHLQEQDAVYKAIGVSRPEGDANFYYAFDKGFLRCIPQHQTQHRPSWSHQGLKKTAARSTERRRQGVRALILGRHSGD